MAQNDVLVYVFLRGGCDALNFIPPAYGQDRKIYEDERPNLNIAAAGPNGLLPLDGHFGLHPSAPELHKLFLEKKLAVIHAAGIPTNSRSHFDAQNIVELGVGEKKILQMGWLTRHLECVGAAPNNTLPAISCGGLPPTSLLGNDRAIVMNEPTKLNLGGQKPMIEGIEEALKSMYQAAPSTWVGASGLKALKSLELVETKNPTDYHSKVGIEYPKNEIGNRLKTLAQLLSMDLGLKVATIDMGGWDTHKNQGAGKEGIFSKQVEQLSQALGSFFQDTIERKITVLVMSEFGRRLRENASRGTDHGHGGFMMVLGHSVNGGKVYGRWPGLRTDQLYERADLAVATDYRTVIAEVLEKRTPNKQVQKVFPGFGAPKFLNLVSDS